MIGEFVLVTPPEEEPVSLAEAKAHLNLTTDDDDDLVTSLVAAARRRVESHLDRSLIATEWVYRLDDFPAHDPLASDRRARLRAIVVPRAPLLSVESVTYVDADGDDAVIDDEEYVVVTGDPGCVHPAPGSDWPSTHPGRVGGVRVACTLGYGDSAADVPDDLKAAIKLIVGYLYDNRGDIEDAEFPVPRAARWLMDGQSWGARP